MVQPSAPVRAAKQRASVRPSVAKQQALVKPQVAKRQAGELQMVKS